MSKYGDDMINAVRDVEDAKRELQRVYATPSAPYYAKRATAARKKIRAAEARHKEIKAKFDAEVAEERRRMDIFLKNTAHLGKKADTVKKGGRPKKGTRRTRRRV